MSPPLEPPHDIRMFAVMLRQMYVALTGEGFTEAQAMAIIGIALANAIASGRGDLG